MSKQVKVDAIETNKLEAIQAGRNYSQKIGESEASLNAFITAMDKLDKDWHTRTKADKTPKGLAVEAVRLDLQAREKERNAKNPDDAWRIAKDTKRKPKKSAVYTGKSGNGKRETRRDADQIWATHTLAYRAKVSSNTVKDKGANLTNFQREVAPLLASIAELVAKHKIKISKAKK